MLQVEKIDKKTVTIHDFYVCSERDDVLYTEKVSYFSHTPRTTEVKCEKNKLATRKKQL